MPEIAELTTPGAERVRRVLHLVPTMGGGGAERQLVYVARAQVAAGWDVHVALLGEGPLFAALKASGATIHFLPASSNYDLRLLARVFSLIGRVKPHIVHTRILQMDVIGGIAAILRGVPWILSERCSGALYGAGLKDRLRVFLAGFASAVEANSRSGVDYWAKMRPSLPRRIIPNAVPLDEFEQTQRADLAALGVDPGAAVILFAGRFDRQKNVLNLVAALQPVLRGRNAIAILCGKGPLAEAAQRLAAELGIEDRVRFPGFVTDVWPLMKAANVFVSPSIFEGRPNGVLEAAACRCPLVVSEIAEHREFLDDTAALFANPTSVDSLSAAMLKALDDPAASRQRASAAWEAVSRFSITRMADRLEDLYRSVINETGHSVCGSPLHAVRQAEIESVRTYFAPGSRVLELGGGDGYQASILTSWGLRVSSVDVAGSETERQWFEVRRYDGRTLPFDGGQFDVVFSSNVLEHIRGLDSIFDELKRVAKREAIHVHLLPSSSWRFWTSVAHYPYLIARYVFKQTKSLGEASHSAPSQSRGRLWRSIRRALVPAAHGEYPSSLAELWYFSSPRWRREFRRHGFEVVAQYPASIFYTGYTLLPELSVTARRRLAVLAGSGCNVFVLRSRNATPAALDTASASGLRAGAAQ